MNHFPPLNSLDTNPSAPAHPKSVADGILFGRFGFRAGWSAAIFLILVTIIIAVSSVMAIAVSGHAREVVTARASVQAHPDEPKPTLNIPFTAGFVTANDGIGFACLLAVCWIFSRAERRKFSAYGIGSKRFIDVIPGAIWGVASMSALVAVLRWKHLLVFDGRALQGTPIFYYGVGWLVAFIFVGFSEEYQFRGYLQFTLMRGFWGLAERISPNNPQPVAFWIGATLMSLGFGALHLGNGGENFLGIAQIVFIGMVFSYALYRTGSLWWGIGFHAMWDWSQSFLFGVADSGNISVGRLFITHPQGSKLLSGGTDGPEGSIFAALAVLLTIFVIRFTTKPGILPSPEQLPRPEESLPPETNAAIA
jgi:membrane protease YdiL (CAAX protease family)